MLAACACKLLPTAGRPSEWEGPPARHEAPRVSSRVSQSDVRQGGGDSSAAYLSLCILPGTTGKVPRPAAAVPACQQFPIKL